MESLLNRYRNITVLLLVIFAQLLLLGWQVKNSHDVRVIRVWTVTAVTPLAKALETLRSGTFGFFQSYVTLHDAHAENQRLQAELGKLKMENHYLKAELATADRAKALTAFQARTPSRTLPARIIATGAGANSKVVFVDRGSAAGVLKGMGVVTPDGIVGKVLAAYPTASEVLLITDPDFAAGVISQKNHVRGTLKGQGYATCKVDFVQNEEKIDVGEWFYTSGDDRVFPKGFPVGQVKVVRNGTPFREIFVDPSGLQHGLEEVLILIEAVHQPVPDAPVNTAGPVYMTPPPPDAASAPITPQPQAPAPPGTEADRLRERYREIGAAQNHTFGEGLPGSKPPDFNIKLPPPGAAPPAVPPPKPAPAKPAAAVPQQ